MVQKSQTTTTTITPFYRIEERGKQINKLFGIESTQYNIRWLGGDSNFHDTLMEAMCDFFGQISTSGGDGEDMLRIEIQAADHKDMCCPIHIPHPAIPRDQLFFPFITRNRLYLDDLIKAIEEYGPKKGLKLKDHLLITVKRIMIPEEEEEEED